MTSGPVLEAGVNALDRSAANAAVQTEVGAGGGSLVLWRGAAHHKCYDVLAARCTLLHRCAICVSPHWILSLYLPSTSLPSATPQPDDRFANDTACRRTQRAITSVIRGFLVHLVTAHGCCTLCAATLPPRVLAVLGRRRVTGAVSRALHARSLLVVMEEALGRAFPS